MIRPASLLAILLLAACGQAGKLYLPDHAPPKPNPLKKVATPPATTPATPGQAPAPAAPASPPPSAN
jgi:predicted small lipoprotein YifL